MVVINQLTHFLCIYISPKQGNLMLFWRDIIKNHQSTLL